MVILYLSKTILILEIKCKTTAGSLALAGNIASNDALLSRRK
jgi:hypothetical protein